MDREQRQQVIADYRQHSTDTGSAEVQIALLTYRIRELTDHLRVHRHDEHSRRGLLTQVGRRRRILTYLARKDTASYQAHLSRLGLRR